MNNKKYIVEYTLSSNWIGEHKVLAVSALNEKEAMKQAEIHAFNNYPTAQFIKVNSVFESKEEVSKKYESTKHDKLKRK